MGRPADYEWKPLDYDIDPVPGDPTRITDEANHLSSVASQITSQVATLRKIAGDNVECGQHAEVIRSSAGDLADQLDKVVGRYQKVSSALKGWIPDLEKAQSWSLQALNQAEGPYKQLNQTVALPSGNKLTAQQKQDIQNYHTAMNKAQGELDAAKTLLHKATKLRDDSGSHCAGVIKSACDDSMKDSWWDKFKNWVSQYAGIIKDICTVLEIIATILAIVALFIPGLDIIVILGIAATALALVGRTMLAATGNGSWFDVALDAFALLTFGMGKVVGSLMKGAFESTEAVAKGLIQAERDASVLGKAGNLLGKLSDAVENSSVLKSAVTGLDRLGLGKFGDGIASVAGKFSGIVDKAGVGLLERASPSLEKTLATVSEDVKPLETALYGGEKESLLMSRNMAAIASRFPESPEIAQLSGKFSTLTNIQRGIFGTATAVDQWDKLVGGFSWYGQNGETPIASAHIPGTEFYGNYKDTWTTEGGFSTGTADKIVDITSDVAPPLGLPMQGFRFAMNTWG
jgi:multidrug efflux pump subunit AcrA (membrane-fusion protein)